MTSKPYFLINKGDLILALTYLQFVEHESEFEK